MPSRRTARIPRDDLRETAAAIRSIFIALGSLFAASGERFMIGTLLRAASRVQDPMLLADLDVFLEQESNHVAQEPP